MVKKKKKYVDEYGNPLPFDERKKEEENKMSISPEERLGLPKKRTPEEVVEDLFGKKDKKGSVGKMSVDKSKATGGKTTQEIKDIAAQVYRDDKGNLRGVQLPDGRFYGGLMPKDVQQITGAYNRRWQTPEGFVEAEIGKPTPQTPLLTSDPLEETAVGGFKDVRKHMEGELGGGFEILADLPLGQAMIGEVGLEEIAKNKGVQKAYNKMIKEMNERKGNQ
mgnify:CR=1 FL=1